MVIKELIDKLYKYNILSREELLFLIENIKTSEYDYLFKMAVLTKEKYYKNHIYLRGLIEISNYCKQGCKYCGINRNNLSANRYRLDVDDILTTCSEGYNLGFRTFVLQGGEDNYYTDEILVNLIERLKNKYKDIAITLSLGERSYRSYKKLYKAGADRYLLRHETCNRTLYKSIHEGLEFNTRHRALLDLKEIGYQVGAGFMVGIPGENKEDLVDNILFLKKLNPEMVGIGPFIPHGKTIYKNHPPGKLESTLIALALVRLFLPYVLLPATTALNSVNKSGRECGFKAGCNVIMPNLSPAYNRSKYSLYDNKAYSGNESASELRDIEIELNRLNLLMDMRKGDNIKWIRK